MTHKICLGCHESLPVGLFPLKRGAPGARCRPCRYALQRESDRGRLKKKRSGAPVDREPTVWLEIGPFREWLHQEVEADSVDGVAARTDVAERFIWRLLYEAPRVRLDVVDLFFCRADETFLLREMYPFLYEFDGEQLELAA